MADATRPSIGAVLAGGASERFGSSKTLAEVGGEPLLVRPVRAVLAAFGAAAVVCRPDTPLPPLPEGVAVWHDSRALRHPLTGVVTALERAGAARVAVVAGDMPAVDAALLVRLADAGSGSVIARSPAGLEPLLAVYAAADLPALRDALKRELPVHAAAEALGAAVLEVPAAAAANVNRPEDLDA